MHGEVVCVVREGGMCGKGEACMGGKGGGGGHAWQERQPLQWTERVLLECILLPDQSGLQPTFGETGLVY